MSLLTGARIIFLGTSYSLTVFGLFCYCHFVIRQDGPWFRFSKRTSLVAGLLCCFVAFTRAPLVSNLTRSLSWREGYGREIASTCQIQLGRLQ